MDWILALYNFVKKEIRATFDSYKTTIIGFAILALSAWMYYHSDEKNADSITQIGIIIIAALTALGFMASKDTNK